MDNIGVGKNIVITLLSYNRPLFLKESIPSLLRNTGRRDFVFIVFDNGSNKETRDVLLKLQKKYKFGLFLNKGNVGQQAYQSLLALDIIKASDYFILTEDDMLWFSPNWLTNLIKAFETKPDITKESQKRGYKNEWGALATNVLVDRVNNGGMWNKRFGDMIEYETNKIWFWANVRAGAGAIIFKTDILQKMMPADKSFGAVSNLLEKYNDAKYPMGHIRDTYIYHAASPFWNQLYPEVWKHKQEGGVIKDAFKTYKDVCEPKGNEWILEELKKGHFSKYAEKLYELFKKGKGRIYSFALEKWGRL